MCLPRDAACFQGAVRVGDAVERMDGVDDGDDVAAFRAAGDLGQQLGVGIAAEDADT